MTEQEVKVPQWQHFGEAVRWAMATAPDRWKILNPKMPKPRPITQLQLIDGILGTDLTPGEYNGALKENAIYEPGMSSGALSEILSGISIPKNPGSFFFSMCRYLAIDLASDDARHIAKQLGYDIIAKRGGVELADMATSRGRYASLQPPVISN